MNGAKKVFVTDADDRVVLDYDGTTGQIQRWYAYGLGPNDVLGQNNVTAATRTTLIPDVQDSYFAALDSRSGALTKAAFQPFGQSTTTTRTYHYPGARIDPETKGRCQMRKSRIVLSWTVSVIRQLLRRRERASCFCTRSLAAAG